MLCGNWGVKYTALMFCRALGRLTAGASDGAYSQAALLWHVPRYFCRSRAPHFSIARDGHLAIISSDHPAGLPGLSARDAAKVLLGIRLYRAALRIFKWCLVVRVPFLWENPQSSFMWHMAGAKSLAAHEEMDDIIVHYCGWGARWRKATRFRGFLLPSLSSLHKKCCPIGKLCGFSLMPHVILQCRDKTGISFAARVS